MWKNIYPLNNPVFITGLLVFSIAFSLLLTFADPTPVRQFLGQFLGHH